ncbi:hypothetical protein GCM10010269_60750 [Streptomyces humidus]|uniref:Uncharacterized protein n=1 Tax=Streptomyces humidus TaxID=52259 RepID=A0A918G2K8_9ACTN|nr:DUF6397 family protein [Streptomyces humidus]GGS13324.1 hypothetical protein GCM10010269_60750 [Streptomyces humidus]
MSRTTIAPPDSVSCTPSRAARELELKRVELDLAVHLGRIRTVPDAAGGARRVPRAEIDRLRAQPGFPDSLRETVLAVGTAEGAALLEVPPTRFTRLARLGLVVPVRFYLNRYRAVVWLYLAEELKQFAADRTNAFLLTGRTPEVFRSQLAAGVDLRPRNWRGRHLGFLLRQAEDPWQHAGALAGFLDPLQVAEIVKDPYERSHLNRFRPVPPAHCAPGTPAAHLVEKITMAEDPDEIDWLRSDLQRTLDEARVDQPAPRPSAKRTVPCPPEQRAAPGEPDTERPARGLLNRLCRRKPAALPTGTRKHPQRLRDAYSARNSPSWTTDTSRRPSRS